MLEFHKLELLGQGEISDVYSAINLVTQEPFVIKTFCVSYFSLFEFATFEWY